MKKAIIYVRGHNTEMQEMFCRVYAADKGYKVLYTTSSIDDVNLCDVMIVSTASRISRDRIEYQEITNRLNKKDIEIEIAVDHDSAEELISLTRYLID